jgi:hypothetical protein
MRILRLDVTAIIACNVRRMVRSDRSAGGIFLEHKGFGLGSQYTFGCLFSVYACVDVCSRTRKAPAMSICLFGMFVMTERILQFAAAFALCSCALYTSGSQTVGRDPKGWGRGAWKGGAAYFPTDKN